MAERPHLLVDQATQILGLSAGPIAVLETREPPGDLIDRPAQHAERLLLQLDAEPLGVIALGAQYRSERTDACGQLIDASSMRADVIDDDGDDRQPEHAGHRPRGDQQDGLDRVESELRPQLQDHARLDDPGEREDRDGGNGASSARSRVQHGGVRDAEHHKGGRRASAGEEQTLRRIAGELVA